MRIAYISTGAGGMYCGTCIHDNTLASALIRKGHEVALVPTYTPMRTDEASVSIDRVFYGGINVYLQEKFAFFRHTPWIFDRLLSSPRLLNLLSKLASTTDARDLGELTVSVLKGEHGHQRKELEKLVTWLKESYKPDLVHLNISLFLGMAHEIKAELNVPILCGIQGEDLFLEELIEPYRTQAIDIMRSRANDVDGYIVSSRYYADYMAGFLKVPREKFHVAMLGIKLDDYIGTPNSKPENPFVIGYLARLAPEKGLHLLVDAYKKVRQKTGDGKIKLRVAGYLGKKDEAYFTQIQRQLAREGHAGDFEYVGEVDRLQKVNFLSSLHVLSVPTVYKESKGLFVLEALANGVPVVQPRHGTFPEFIEATGGGILVDPQSSDALAAGLEHMMSDHSAREGMGRRGQEAVRRYFTDQVMADAMVEVYKQYL
jgi:glycosyltransferase involved in cell wall biosynthesis